MTKDKNIDATFSIEKEMGKEDCSQSLQETIGEILRK